MYDKAIELYPTKPDYYNNKGIIKKFYYKENHFIK